MSKHLNIGLDLGGSFIKTGYGSIEEGLLYFETITNDAYDRESLLLLLKKAVVKLIDSLNDSQVIDAISLGTPGIVNIHSGEILENCPNIKGWVGANPKVFLEQEFKKSVFIENDADLMTLGETYANNFEEKNVLGITIGTGIGSGYVCSGKLYHGSYSSLELGHMVVVPQGKDCPCGKKGCVEIYCSATAIVRNVKNNVGEDISLDKILQLYRNKDNRIVPIIDDSYDKLGLAVANSVMILGADVVIFGGGITESEFFDIEPLVDAVFRYLTPYYRSNVSIMKANLKNKAAVWGGIVLAERKKIKP